MGWTKQPPIIGGKTVGCFNCGYKPEVAELSMVIAVGFGEANLKKNGKIIWSENNQEWRVCLTVAQAEEMAKQDPDNDWRIELIGPLSEAEYQRHSENLWVLIRTGIGFA